VFALNRTERRIVMCAALSSFVGAFALVPSTAGSRLPARPAPQTARERALALPTGVVSVRDPFAPQVDDPDGPSSPAPLASIAPLPPNAGAGVFPFAVATTAPRLLAVVSGPQPRALVDDRGASRLVSRGERFAGARIATIDAGGVTLDDGRRIGLGTENRR
jgi:hypothetical protein